MSETKKCDVLALGLAIGILAAAYAFLLGLTAWLFDWGTGTRRSYELSLHWLCSNHLQAA